MTNTLLIRHATHDLVGTKIFGRTPGIHLNNSGRLQAERLADELSVLPIEAVYSGPLERARETAEPVARKLHLELQVADEFDELHMGDWTNRRFSELDRLPEWQRWNHSRSKTTPPNGESMLAVQQRALQKLADLAEQFGCVAIFTHGDVIRAAITYFLGMHLDLLFRFQIDPGSISLVQMDESCAIVRLLNWTEIGDLSV
jgi:broad specificity phosphatase PhoE